MDVANPYTVLSFAAYLAVVLAIGIWAARFSSAGVSEFFVGGRVMNRFVVALSAVVSGRSAWLILGLTGMAYMMGAAALWAAVGYIVVELLLFLFYAPRLRRFSEVHDCITVPDFVAARFGDHDGRLRILLVVILLVFMTGYVAAQFVAGGKAFAVTFGMPESTGILATAVIVLLYTILGGFLAVSVSDAVQGVFMMAALVGLPVIAVLAFGGPGAMGAVLAEIDPTLLDPLAIGTGALIGFVGIGLGSPGNPHILVRYMSIRDPADLRYAAVVGTLWNVLMAAGAVFIGLAGRAFVPEVGALPGADPENIFPVLAETLLHPVLLGVVIAAVLAAIMSTADSQLLVAASSAVRDFYETVWRRGERVSQRVLVRISRWVVLALVLVSLGLAFLAEDLVFWLVLFAWAGLGAALGPTSILALFWRRTNRPGVMAGIASGALVTVVWRLTAPFGGAVYELLPGFAAGLLATIVVSLATRREDGPEVA